MSDLALPATIAVPSAASTRSDYRPDIDGLRAIAVLAVVATHAGLPGCAGGYLGVDVFFVISGFLIVRNLQNTPQAGWRGLVSFYGRRMRRTLPALYLVAGVTLVAGLALLLPTELEALVRSLLAMLFLVPNVLFLSQSGYFDQAAATKPLLHTWSLGVEEQFYLLAPLLPLAFAYLAPRRRVWALLGLFVGALTLCVSLQALAPPAAFYLLPARLWEFLAGALVAARVIPPVRAPWQAEACAGAALIALGASLACFTATTPHPSWPTLLPCLATAALIHVGQTHATVTGRLLGNRALAGLGLISYSIYLWHWPLLVFAHFAEADLSAGGLVAGAALLLGLSALSWRFVEVPFRQPGSPLRSAAPRILPAAALGLAIASLTILLGQGLPQRFPPDVAQVAGYADYLSRRQFREGSCFITSRYGDAALFDRASCLRAVPGRPSYLLVGDSHAAHLWVGFKTVFADAAIMQATASGCRPLLKPTGKRYCVDLIDQVLHRDLPRQPVDTIFLAAAWELRDLAQLPRTIAYLQHFARRVIVLGPIPSYPAPLPTLLARDMLQGRGDPPASLAYVSDLDRSFKAALPAVSYVSLVDLLCPAGKCQVWAAPDVPLQFDESHLTTEGSKVVALMVEQALER